MFLLYLVAALTFLLLFVIVAPGFLFMENIPRKADAVILFVGPGNEARRDEARQLIKDGYAHFLLIPYSGEVFAANSSLGLVRLNCNQSREKLFHRVWIATTYKNYFENTHIETLEAKRMMDDLGLRSAMLVSSAFHMRRIELIAGRVFDGRKYSISCNPARWQASYTFRDWFNKERRGNIISEYIKMFWFLVYSIAG